MASVKDQAITVPASYVMFTAEPMTDLMNEFSSAFGSGIVVPDKGVKAPGLKITT
jgi:hypothetical protein